MVVPPETISKLMRYNNRWLLNFDFLFKNAGNGKAMTFHTNGSRNLKYAIIQMGLNSDAKFEEGA